MNQLQRSISFLILKLIITIFFFSDDDLLYQMHAIKGVSTEYRTIKQMKKTELLIKTRKNI